MANVNFRKATEEAKVDILHKMEEFESIIEAGTSVPGHIMSMDELEKEWELLEDFTHKKYSDMVSRYLDAVDERGIVESKKRIPCQRNQADKQAEAPKGNHYKKREALFPADKPRVR